jgi:hypothetical protein
VHFPENHVIPIDDSSYENSSDEFENKKAFVDRKLSDSSSDDLRQPAKKSSPQKFLKKKLISSSANKKEPLRKDGSPKESAWRQEREAFVTAMRISRKIKEIEDDENLDFNE